jgi:hypothetical protein
VRLAIENGTSDRLVAELTREVRAVDRRLAWELMPGGASRHLLVVTGEGDADATWVAVRCMRSAPDPDAYWSYLAARPRQALRVFTVGGHRIDLRAFTASATRDEAAERLDIRVSNPSFATMPPEVRKQAARLFVDALIGELDTARWVGMVEVRLEVQALTPDDLQRAVEELQEQSSGSRWIAIAREAADRQAILICVNAALKRFDHLDDRWHAALDVGELSGGDATTHMVSDPVSILGHAGGTLVAVTKDRFRRRFHFVYPGGSGVPAAARAWAASARSSVTVALDFDPGWAFLDELTGGKVGEGVSVEGAAQFREIDKRSLD